MRPRAGGAGVDAVSLGRAGVDRARRAHHRHRAGAGCRAGRRLGADGGDAAVARRRCWRCHERDMAAGPDGCALAAGLPEDAERAARVAPSRARKPDGSRGGAADLLGDRLARRLRRGRLRPLRVGGAADAEVHAFVNELERAVGTYLYGRRMYETMIYWETALDDPGRRAEITDFAAIWQAADKIVYSRTLEAGVHGAHPRVEREFDADAVRRAEAARRGADLDRGRRRAGRPGDPGRAGRRAAAAAGAGAGRRRQAGAAVRRAGAAASWWSSAASPAAPCSCATGC